MDLDSANNHLNAINAEAKGITEIFSTFDESLDKQTLYLCNDMAMYKVLLQYVRESRDKDWDLHYEL